MKKLVYILVGCFLTVVVCSKKETKTHDPLEGTGIIISPDNPDMVSQDSSGNVFASNKILIKFKEGIGIDTRNSLISSINGKIAGEIPKIGYYLIEVSDGSVEAIISELSKKQEILVAEKDYAGEFDGMDIEALDVNATLTNGRVINKIWGYKKIWFTGTTQNMELKYNSLTQLPMVAIIDSSFRTNHIDLDDNILHDLAVDMADKDNDVNPEESVDFDEEIYGHGTHLAGIIAAENNNIGINGIAYRNPLLVVKIAPTRLYGKLQANFKKHFFSSKLASAIEYATDKGARVINMSLNVPKTNALNDTIALASSNQIILVASAGNKETDASNTFPAPHSDVISVGATDDLDLRATGWASNEPGSNFSMYDDPNILSLAAPGDLIMGLNAAYMDYSNGADSYRFVSGTSQAAPFVSGLAALLLSLKPELAPVQVEQMMRDTADNILVTYPDNSVHTWKRINAYNAVRCVVDNVCPQTQPPPSSGREICIANHDGNSIGTLDATQNGNWTPLRTISGLSTGLSWPVGPAVDKGNNEMFVINWGNNSVRVFSITTSGNITPIRTIAGASTGLSSPIGIAIDTTNNEIFVVGGTYVRVYPRTGNGNIAPLRTISGASTGLNAAKGIAVDFVNNELLISNDTGNSITIYPRTGNGNIAPLRTISGALTGINSPYGLGLDLANNEIIVANINNNSMTIYSRTATGNVSPLRTIAGSLTLLSWPNGVVVDTINNEIFVTDYNVDSILRPSGSGHL